MNEIGKVFVLSAWLAATAAFTPVRADEAAVRQALDKQVQALVKAHDFKSLDILAERVRGKDAVGPSGIPLLGHYYDDLMTHASDYQAKDACGVAERKMADDWLASAPKSMAAQLIYSKALLEQAFCARGCDYADKVPRDKWPIYNGYVEQARLYLMAHRQIGAHDPEWFATMETVANDQSWPEEDFLRLVQLGVTTYPTYYRLWDLGIFYYAPRWNGSDERTEQFAQLAREKAERDISEQIYARLYWYVNDQFQIKNLRKETRIDWEYMKKSMRAVDRIYPDRWNTQTFAKLTCHAQDYTEMDHYIQEMAPGAAATSWQLMARHGVCDHMDMIGRGFSIGSESPAPSVTPAAHPTAEPRHP